MAKTIKIELNADPASSDCGVFAAEAFGYKGKGCDVELAAFQKLGVVNKQNKKPEYKQHQQGLVSGKA